MPIELVAKRKAEVSITKKLESFWLYFDFGAAAANGGFQVAKGYFATFLAEQGTPSDEKIEWTDTDFELRGGDGVGNLTIAHARLRARHVCESLTEFGRLHVFEFDDTSAANRPKWLDADTWTAPYNPGVIQKVNQCLFHTLDWGTAASAAPAPTAASPAPAALKPVLNRWAHWISAEQIAGNTQSVTAVLPFSGPTVFAYLLRSTTVDAEKKSMPVITLKTFYGQQDKSNTPWTHFHGDSTALTGEVKGYAMVAQGAFQSIPLSDLAEWYMPANATPGVEAWDADKVGRRLFQVVTGSLKVSNRARDLESFDDTPARPATVPHPSGNRPVEVVHLRGLNNPNPVF